MLDRLKEIMHRLRNECPWDKEQDLGSLRAYLVEEAYEVLAAMDQALDGNSDDLIEELGDLQLQILFQAEILSEIRKEPVLSKILKTLEDKLVRRHPHVFGDATSSTKEEVAKTWEAIKAQEKPKKTNSLMKDVLKPAPALVRSQKIGDRSKKVGFDWSHADEVWSQFNSEIQELKEASSAEAIEHEVGDVLFSLVQWIRHQGFDAEVCLAKANERFLRRFQTMEDICQQEDEDFKSLSIDKKEALWKAAKAQENQ